MKLRRALRPLCFWVAAAIVSPVASAQDLEVRLDAVDEVVESLLRRSRALEGQVAPGSGYITEDQAVQRFQDYLFLHLVGDYEEAAQGFFALVTSGALGDAGLHRDAEWYLADSLFLVNNLATASARFEVIANEGKHPFRADAVRRLLELYAKSGQTDKFYDVYDREIVRGRVEATDDINYAVGKAFYAQGESEKAAGHFERVKSGSDMYGKALYFRATILIADKRLSEAAFLFKEAADLSVDTVDARRVHDLSLLALGRIDFELGNYALAIDHYDRIGGDSEYAADQQFELVWSYIELARGEEDWDRQQAAWQNGLRIIEIFLLAFPEHEYTAQLMLVVGHLHMAKVEHDSALTAYENVISEYSPIRDRFQNLADSQSDPGLYFEKVLQLENSDAAEMNIPGFAVAMMRTDPELGRAIDLFSQIDRQETDIAGSEAMIRELRLHLMGDGGIGGFEQMRYDAVLASSMATEHQLALLELEELWLYDTLSVERRTRLDPLHDRRMALISAVREDKFRVEEARKALEQHRLGIRRVRRLAEEVMLVVREHEEELRTLRGELEEGASRLDDVSRAAVVADIKYLQQDLTAAKAHLETLDLELANLRAPRDQIRQAQRPAAINLLKEIESLRLDYGGQRRKQRHGLVGPRFDGMHQSLKIVQDRLAKVADGLDDVEKSELVLLRSRFEHEVQEVASQRVALGETVNEAEKVSIDLTRAGFGRLEDFFADSVLKADMGIIDVYWAQKLETSDEMERVKVERQGLLEELERRFELIRLKIRR